VRENIPLYNIVTVNNDKRNDRYTLDERLTGSKLTVINRWGEVIYAADSYENDWSADQVSPGQYFCLIESKCYGTYKSLLTIVK
jgi:hypothetical protein